LKKNEHFEAKYAFYFTLRQWIDPNAQQSSKYPGAAFVILLSVQVTRLQVIPILSLSAIHYGSLSTLWWATVKAGLAEAPVLREHRIYRGDKYVYTQ
jgi:hypothetical protein